MSKFKKLVSQPLFLPIFCMILVMAVNIIYDVMAGNFAFNFFTISIRNGVLYGRIIDILNRGSEIAVVAIGRTPVSYTHLDVYKRQVKYHFEITGGGESVCLYEDGFVKAAERFPADRMIQRFIYPWMNRADIMKVPDWAENIVWYQIFPDRFCRKNPGEKRHSCREWACQEDATWKEFYGGDLAGIRSRLAYIADLSLIHI